MLVKTQSTPYLYVSYSVEKIVIEGKHRKSENTKKDHSIMHCYFQICMEHAEDSKCVGG